jgi:hypothetical protein
MADKTEIVAKDFSAAGQEPVAYRYKDARGQWRYVGAPLTKGWDFPQGLNHEPLLAAPQPATFDPADMATASAQGFRDGESAERARCAQAVRTTLANWRCIPSAHLREFAELVLAGIEKPVATTGEV